jgi:hypothetical protein
MCHPMFFLATFMQSAAFSDPASNFSELINLEGAVGLSRNSSINAEPSANSE